MEYIIWLTKRLAQVVAQILMCYIFDFWKHVFQWHIGSGSAAAKFSIKKERVRLGSIQLEVAESKGSKVVTNRYMFYYCKVKLIDNASQKKNIYIYIILSFSRICKSKQLHNFVYFLRINN